jgi:hypothetical protein
VSTTQVRYETETRLGPGAWTGRILAGTLMIISGVLSILVGIAAITRASYFTVVSGTYPYHWTVHGWGWTQLILGIVVFAAGIAVFSGKLWARIVGVILAVLSGIGSFMFIPYRPIWSLIVIGVDLFMIWALMTPGRRRAARY